MNENRSNYFSYVNPYRLGGYVGPGWTPFREPPPYQPRTVFGAYGEEPGLLAALPWQTQLLVGGALLAAAAGVLYTLDKARSR